MGRERSIAFYAASIMLLFVAPIAAGKVKDNSMLLKQIQKTIVKVRVASEISKARIAADRLSQLTEKIAPKDVDDKTLAKLAALLGCSDDTVRFLVAVSIGNLGPRAKSVVPKLLETLRKVDCLNGALTSADAIRDALKRIGVTPPPRPPPRPGCARIGG